MMPDSASQTITDQAGKKTQRQHGRDAGCTSGELVLHFPQIQILISARQNQEHYMLNFGVPRASVVELAVDNVRIATSNSIDADTLAFFQLQLVFEGASGVMTQFFAKNTKALDYETQSLFRHGVSGVFLQTQLFARPDRIVSEDLLMLEYHH